MSVRSKLARYPQADLVSALDEVWNRRRELELAAAAVSEELISRAIIEHVPNAAFITVVEDHSHDSPHGHLKEICDQEGRVLVAGMTDEWHDLSWSAPVDECVYDMYLIAPSVFTLDSQVDGHHRSYRFPVHG